MKTNLEKFSDLLDIICKIVCVTMIVFSIINDDYVKAIFYLLLATAWGKKYE